MSGQAQQTITTHELKIGATFYLPVSDMQVPTGSIETVAHTPFDFTSYKPIGKDIALPDRQLQISHGYDHSFVLEEAHTPVLKPAAAVRDPFSGRILHVLTTEPAVHFYTGNFLENLSGKNGAVYGPRSGFV